MSGDPIVYCAAHDRPLSLCGSPERCRERMTAWGLYEAVDAEWIAVLTEELGLYGDA